jgi:23S rRNA (pseudouridine1915-N3)-methyltransferase
MPIIKILSIGKNKEKWLDNAISEYQKRLQSTIKIEFQWLRDDEKLISATLKTKNPIGLDPNGKVMTSEQFAGWFSDLGANITFIIGGAQGLPQILKNTMPLISLSKLTFTHQITRLILIEQVYRAIEINKGSSYHK